MFLNIYASTYSNANKPILSCSRNLNDRCEFYLRSNRFKISCELIFWRPLCYIANSDAQG